MTSTRYNEGDILIIRGNKYRVAQVDLVPGREGPLQYRLTATGEGPEAILTPESSSQEKRYAIQEFYNVESKDIHLLEKNE